MVFGDISMVYYWFVHNMEGDNGQDIRHTQNLDFFLLFCLLYFGCACPLCVLVEGETLLHRACKRNQVETVFQILALPGTDVNVKGKAFLLCLFSLTALSPSSHYATTVCSWVSTAINTGGGKKWREIGLCLCACVIIEVNLQLQCKGCV